jgi:hypothetical protein
MAEKIKYSLNVQVVGESGIPANGEIETGSYHKLQINLDAGNSNIEFALQPNFDPDANLIKLLMIKSSTYGSALTYKINDKSSTKTVVLDGPHAFIGSGAVKILDVAPKTLFFTNGLAEPVVLDILVARDVKP